MPGDPQTLEIVQTVTALGRSLKIAVTAEGVETQEQSIVLRQAGCCFGQGYYYAHPMPINLLLERYAWDAKVETIVA